MSKATFINMDFSCDWEPGSLVKLMHFSENDVPFVSFSLIKDMVKIVEDKEYKQLEVISFTSSGHDNIQEYKSITEELIKDGYMYVHPEDCPIYSFEM